MADLTVDYGLLQNSQSQLSSIKSAFDGLKSSVSGASDAWGDGGIADAMNTFAGNWTYHRAKMSDLLQTGVDKFSKTLSEFQKADSEIGSNTPSTSTSSP